MTNSTPPQLEWSKSLEGGTYKAALDFADVSVTVRNEGRRWRWTVHSLILGIYETKHARTCDAAMRAAEASVWPHMQSKSEASIEPLPPHEVMEQAGNCWREKWEKTVHSECIIFQVQHGSDTHWEENPRPSQEIVERAAAYMRQEREAKT